MPGTSAPGRCPSYGGIERVGGRVAARPGRCPNRASFNAVPGAEVAQTLFARSFLWCLSVYPGRHFSRETLFMILENCKLLLVSLHCSARFSERHVSFGAGKYAN